MNTPIIDLEELLDEAKDRIEEKLITCFLIRWLLPNSAISIPKRNFWNFATTKYISLRPFPYNRRIPETQL